MFKVYIDLIHICTYVYILRYDYQPNTSIISHNYHFVFGVRTGKIESLSKSFEVYVQYRCLGRIFIFFSVLSIAFALNRFYHQNGKALFKREVYNFPGNLKTLLRLYSLTTEFHTSPWTVGGVADTSWASLTARPHPTQLRVLPASWPRRGVFACLRLRGAGTRPQGHLIRAEVSPSLPAVPPPRVDLLSRLRFLTSSRPASWESGPSEALILGPSALPPSPPGRFSNLEISHLRWCCLIFLSFFALLLRVTF